MTITDKVNTYPIANATKGIGNSLQWEIVDFDIFTAGTLIAAKLTAVIQAGAVTGNFTFEGKTFTINAGSPYTKSTFKIEATALATAQNFVNMLLANIDIAARWSTVITPLGANAQIEVFPNNYNQKLAGTVVPSFSNANISITHSDYNDVDLRSGLKYAWSLYELTATGDHKQLTQLQALTPFLNNKTGGALQVPIDFADAVSGLLSTTFPYLKTSELQYDLTMYKRIFAKVGIIEKLSCTELDSDFTNTSAIAILNAANPYQTINGMFAYSYDSPENVGNVLFLNDLQYNLTITKDTFAWLWFYDNVNVQHTNKTNKMFAFYTFIDAAGATISVVEKEFNTGAIISGHADKTGVIIIPVGGANIPTTIPNGTVEVQVTVVRRNVTDTIDTVISEIAKLPYIVEDCNEYEFYFLNTKGGYDTIRFPFIEEITAATTQNEVTLQSFARNYEGYGSGGSIANAVLIDYLNFLNLTGTKQTNTKAAPIFKIKGEKYRADETSRNYLQEFFASGDRKMRLVNLADMPELALNENVVNKLHTANIILIHSELVVYKDQGLIEPIFTFKFAHNLSSND